MKRLIQPAAALGCALAAMTGLPAKAASVRQEVVINAPPAFVWEALKDFGAIDKRLARGFVADAKMEGSARIVTFANGASARELLVDVDDGQRRLVYAVQSERLLAHSASAQVFAKGRRTRFVWISDFLPNELEPYIAAQMEAGAAAMKKTLEEDARSAK